MGQFTLVFLFIITLIAGAFAYFFPKQQPVGPIKIATDSSIYDTPQESGIKRTQQLNMTTNAMGVQIYHQIDDLTQEQKHLMGMIDYEQQVLDSTNKEISGTTDILKLKALGLELENDQGILAAHGQQLVALNDQLNKNRQLLAEERGLVNSSASDQSAALFDKVKEQIEEQRQKVQDEKNK